MRSTAGRRPATRLGVKSLVSMRRRRPCAGGSYSRKAPGTDWMGSAWTVGKPGRSDIELNRGSVSTARASA